MKDTSPDALVWCKARGACSKAIEWLKKNKIKTMNEAWLRCQRYDWMEWALIANDEDSFCDGEVGKVIGRCDGAFKKGFGFNLHWFMSDEQNRQATDLLRTFLMPEGVKR